VHQQKTDVVPSELLFAKEAFIRYYASHPVGPPLKTSAREFGFMFFERNYVQRHVSLRNGIELNNYLRTRGPSHAYYSAAYYGKPDAQTMAEKGWTGADLIFDLDADHVRGSEKLPYEEMLKTVKSVMIHLYDDFIISDLGFNEKETEIVFSGGRGYHIHIYSESVKTLGSHERREIVDYITAAGLDAGALFRMQVVGVDEERRGKRITAVKIPSEADGGWYAKAFGVMNDVLSQMTDVDSAFRLLTEYGIPEKQARRMASNLTENGGRERIRETGLIDIFGNSSRHDDNRIFAEMLTRRTVERSAGQTDEPVTSDIHRLIRLPGTLHGKTALKVVSLKRDELDNFDPLTDAVPDFGDESVKITAGSSFTTPPFRGESISIMEGINEVPVNIALFLMLRRQARLP
jgi:DNA primase small subunit